MSLTEDLAELRTSQPVRKCRTCDWYGQQPEDVRAEFDACVDEPAVSNRALLRACAKHGLTAGRSQFGIHIREHHGK